MSNSRKKEKCNDKVLLLVVFCSIMLMYFSISKAYKMGEVSTHEKYQGFVFSNVERGMVGKIE